MICVIDLPPIPRALSFACSYETPFSAVPTLPPPHIAKVSPVPGISEVIVTATGATPHGTRRTGNQVRVVVVALLAAELLVVDLQVLSGTADLTLPAISLEHLLPKLLVQLGIQPQSGGAWVEFASRGLFGHFLQKGLPLFTKKCEQNAP